MIVGFSTSILWVVFTSDAEYVLYEMVPAFIAGMGATIVVSMVTQARNGFGIRDRETGIRKQEMNCCRSIIWARR